MKIKPALFLITTLLVIYFSSCNPISYIPIETVKPSKVNLPIGLESFALINLDNDLNNDSVIDTLLSKIVYKELVIGCADVINNTAVLDPTNFKPQNYTFPRDQLFTNGSPNWLALRKLGIRHNVDAIILIDSLTMLYSEKEETHYPYDYPEYYRQRMFDVNTKWIIFDLANRKIVYEESYSDTFIWENAAYDAFQLNVEFPRLSENIKESAYWIGYEFAVKVFPQWISSKRIFFHNGNGDFREASEYVMQNDWDKAIPLWEKYTKHSDPEISSRALFNLGLAAELLGNTEVAIEYINKSYKIKPKKVSINYLSVLNRRKKDESKMLKQF